MGLKDFLIAVGIFTVIYFLFFIIYDSICLKVSSRAEKNKAFKAINNLTYHKFALFYGIVDSKVSEDLIRNIYNDCGEHFEKYISIACKKYDISNYEYIIIILYLEYLDLIIKREFDLDKGLINDYSFQDMQYINKYTPYFNRKASFEDIKKETGNNTVNELYYMDKTFLFPGVRIINNIICYFDDKEVSL